MYKLDYVWLDGYEVKNLRMKTRYFNGYELDMKDLPIWGFDGSSTMQADGEDSDCILEPVKLYKNPVDPLGMTHIVQILGQSSDQLLISVVDCPRYLKI